MKRILFILIVVLMVPVVASSQNSTEVYKSVEIMPRFPGGEAALMKFIQSHLHYPEGTDGEGYVIVQFVVETDGGIGEVKVVRGLDRPHDREAVRVVKSLPKFTPGRHNNQAVAVWYTLPIRFDYGGSTM